MLNLKGPSSRYRIDSKGYSKPQGFKYLASMSSAHDYIIQVQLSQIEIIIQIGFRGVARSSLENMSRLHFVYSTAYYDLNNALIEEKWREVE